MNRRNAEHQINMAEALRKQDHMLMTSLSTQFVDFKECIKNEHQENIDRMELSAQNFVSEAAKENDRKEKMYVSELAEAFGRINLQNERNAEAQSVQEQLRQAYMHNELHVQSLRSEIAEAAATRFADEPFCQSPIPPRNFTTYNGADTPPLLRAGSPLPPPGFAGDDSFTFENESLARTSLTRTVTLNHAAASSTVGGEGNLAAGGSGGGGGSGQDGGRDRDRGSKGNKGDDEPDDDDEEQYREGSSEQKKTKRRKRKAAKTTRSVVSTNPARAKRTRKGITKSTKGAERSRRMTMVARPARAHQV